MVDPVVRGGGSDSIVPAEADSALKTDGIVIILVWDVLSHLCRLSGKELLALYLSLHVILSGIFPDSCIF